MTDVPHFAFPFRFENPWAAVTEQDSIDEVSDCVAVILSCPAGFRVELPPFGLPDPTFHSPSPDLDEIRTAIETWEPRAGATLAESPDEYDELIARIAVNVQLRTEA